MRLLKAIVAVALVVALLAIPDNGKDDGTSERGSSLTPRAPDAAISTKRAPLTGNPARAVSSQPQIWPTCPESASVEHGDYVKLSCPVLVYGTSEEVWEVLTTARRFFMWYPHWDREDNAMRRLTAVGDTIAFYENGRLAGRSVVTWFEPLKELRIAHELDDDGWAGSILISLDRTANGVGLAYEELLPSSGQDIDNERWRVSKQVMLIKRLAEGE